MRTRTRTACAGLALLPLAACTPGGAAEAGPPRPEITVLAAASLTDVFTELGEQFEQQRHVTVTFSFGASSALAQQVVSGAPADVLATASPATMALVVDDGAAVSPRVFARNRLQIAVPAGNPGGVSGLADLAREELTIALCSPEVPCGAASEQVLAAAGLIGAPDTLEQDVRAVLSKVRLDEVDAALVYRTDVRAAGDDVEGITVPEADSVVLDYPVAALRDSEPADAASAFVDFVLSDDAQQVLGRAGFDPA